MSTIILPTYVQSARSGRIRFIAVGSEGRVATCHSPNVWTERTPAVAAGYRLSSVAASPGICIAVGDLGASPNLAIKSLNNGITWTDVSPSPDPGLTYMSGIASNGTGGFVFVGHNGGIGDGSIYRWSGTGWVQKTTPVGCGPITGITYGNGKYVAVTNRGWSVVSTDDGLTWNKYAIDGTGPAMYAVCWTGTNFLAVGNDGTTWYSATGLAGWTFTSAPGAGVFTFNCVASDGTNAVAGTNNGSGVDGIYQSVNLGVTWNNAPSGGAETYYGACFGETYFVVGAINSHIYHSRDSLAWTLAVPWAASHDIYGVAYVAP